MAIRQDKALTLPEGNELVADVFTSAVETLQPAVNLREVDTAKHVFQQFNRRLFSNQVEIVRMFWNTAMRQADIIESRQGGKTTASTIGVLGAALANLYPTLEGITQIGWFANKQEQAVGIGGVRCWRILEDNYSKFKKLWDRDGSAKGHLSFKRESGLNSQEFATIDFKTANPQAFSEGQTISLMVIDEANRLHDIVWGEVLLPMGSATAAKIVKIGVPRHRNNFYLTAHDPTWFHIRADWTECPIYAYTEPCELRHPVTRALLGVYGGYPLRRMPLSLKRQMWPDNPILHVLATNRGQPEEWLRLFDWPGDMGEDDFKTQYQLHWLTDTDLFLKEPQQQALFASGQHAPLTAGIHGETYFYGVDPCSEKAVLGLGEGRTKKAHASLSIWRLTSDRRLEKVFCDEKATATSIEQVQWATELCHPRTGQFRCVAGCWDYTGVGIPTVNLAHQHGLPILPITYGKTCTATGKNYKNTMFDHFSLQIDLGRCVYPNPVLLETPPINPTWQVHREEWEDVEKKVTAGMNADIRAPGDNLDDGPNSDVLATFIADHFQQYRNELGVRQRANIALVGRGIAAR